MEIPIALIDCNAFYCSCERLFRPDIKNKPVVVLSNNDGCAVSMSREAKELGIKVGDPYFKFKDLCLKKDLQVFSANFSLYTDISNRVMSSLSVFSSEIEIYSVDEAFLNLSGIKDLTIYGQNIRDLILTNVGVPVGVGIGPTKVLAKVANRIAKKSKKAQGVVNLMDKKLQDIALAQVDIGDVWGVGRANSEKMKALGIKNAKQLRDFSNEKLILKIFTKVGLQIKHELMGVSCFPLNLEAKDKKEIICSRTFANGVLEKSHLKESIASYISSAAEKMRSQDSLCQEVSVFARTNPYKETDQFYMFERRRLTNPTANSITLIKIAHEMIDANFKEGYEYKKAGVSLSHFFNSSDYQLDIFSENFSEKEEKLMKVMDRVNKREGDLTIKSGACGTHDKAWNMNRNFKSPRYTTSWLELKKFN